MTQEEKELLLKDLCSRLPYKCKYKASKGITHWHKLTLSTGTIDKITDDYYDEIKPYLRSMSSMTEDEWDDFNNYRGVDGILMPIANELDWLNAHHFDYRGLIEKGLAIEAPKDMYV